MLQRSPLTLALLVGVALAAVSGCGGRQIPPPADVVDDPIIVFESMLDRLRVLRTVRSTIAADVRGPMGRGKVEQIVLARAPSDLRVETISPYDTTLSVFLIRNDRLTYYDLGEGVWVTGRATPENIARFIPFWMSSEDLVRVLFGGPPLDAVSADPETYRMSWDTRTGTYRLILPVDTGGELVLRVRHGAWTLHSAHRFNEVGEQVFELHAGAYAQHEVDDEVVLMPRRIRFFMESEALDISLDVVRMDVNVTLADLLFDLSRPGGVSAQDLD